MAKILISGGSGMIGRAVTGMLVKNGHEVRWLSRNDGIADGIRKYKWSPDSNYIDAAAFEDITHLVHLAGAGIADHRWTASYKKQILDSRIRSASLLYDTVARHGFKISAVAGASAVGFYGSNSSGHTFVESDAPGKDFLADVCVQWENSYEPFSSLGARVVALRTAVVLSKQGGIYKKLSPFFSKGIGAAVASGNQPFPWIHISDLAAAYCTALLDENFKGPFNAVATEMISNSEFSVALAHSFRKPLFLPDVPGVFLKAALGEMASTLTKGEYISNKKLLSRGFEFVFPDIHGALKNLASQ